MGALPQFPTSLTFSTPGGRRGWPAGKGRTRVRIEDREVFGGDEDGDGEAAEGEVVGQVEKWEDVALGWVGEDQYMDSFAIFGA